MLVSAVLTFAFWWTVLLKMIKKKGFTSSTFLISIYTLSFLCSVLLIILEFQQKNPKIDNYFGGYLFLTVSLWLYLYPFIEINDSNFEYLRIPSKKIIKCISVILSVCSIYSIVFYLPVAYKMIAVDIADIANVRSMVTTGNHPFIEPSIKNGLAKLFAFLYNLQLTLFFINLIIDRKIRFFSWVILFSSLSYPVFVLAFMGRDGIVFWIFSFIFSFLLFRKYLHGGILKTLKKITVVIFSFFLFFFLIISVGRFLVANEDAMQLFESLLSYIGQGPINFAEYYYIPNMISDGGQSLFLPLVKDVDLNYKNQIDSLLYNYDIVPWIFKTFISSIYTSIGSLFLLIFGLILLFVYKYSFKEKKKGVLSFPFVLVYTVFFTVYSQGVFYLTYYHNIAHLSVLLIFLLALFSSIGSSVTIKL
ncbi:oligosaccharide repeat unit polymerase [Bacteroides intestinalis]|jgi:oligosaccharide repeat unit polymerase|uniref:oligosaccharide repeat unit polymerase n=1 Tax=Bacteroides intestinalis TaxID=329854 RepID=UPI000E497446|nr:oligosaccharide repeat unit polymerase [Bacteroides intestinalis]RHE78407.1 oligosaccharide repeat unit polymerase [Bacteroides intestinalis]